MATPKVATQIRIDEETHLKCKYIASEELRSLNSQMEYFIVKGVQEYEKLHGVIHLPEH